MVDIWYLESKVVGVMYFFIINISKSIVWIIVLMVVNGNVSFWIEYSR